SGEGKQGYAKPTRSDSRSRQAVMKVTVLLTTYNHRRFIAEAIDSVLMQRAPFDWELVIIDDCSTDGTSEIAADYQSQNPNRVRLVIAEFNTRNLRHFASALQSSTAKYIAMLDGDDYWVSSEKLQHQVAFLDSRPDFAICAHGVQIVDEYGRKLDELNPIPLSGYWTVDDLLDYNQIYGCSPLIRRDTLLSLPPWYASCVFGDWELYVVAAIHGKIGTTGEVMA